MEELRRSLGGRGRDAGDELRQLVELDQRFALRDPLRAERDVDVATGVGEVLRDVRGRPRVDRAPHDDERALAELAQHHGQMELTRDVMLGHGPAS